MCRLGRVFTSTNGVDIEWCIDDFFSLTDTRNGYWSPDFSLGGQEWFMRIFPKGGWNDGEATGYVELIFIRNFSGHPIMQDISLSLKTATGEKDNEQSAKLFQGFGKRGLGHNFLQFISRSELLWRQSELVPNGVLTVVCSMQRTASDKSASNHKNALCSHCQKPFNLESLPSHEKKCIVKCPQCSYVVLLQDWYDHECQSAGVEGEACAPGSSINILENRVLHDFKELFLKKEDCDVTIKVRGSEFPAHKLILKVRSPVFASTFRHDMKENATGVVEIEDCDASTFSDFLCFLYCGDVSTISSENVFRLFTVADKYEVLDLRGKCLEFMKKNLTVDNFCETATLALCHSETELIKLCINYFQMYAPKIKETVQWQKFLAENPKESNEFLDKLLVSNSSSSY